MDNFFDELYLHFPQGHLEDQHSWRLSESGKFEVWAFYKDLRGSIRAHFPWREYMGVKVPHKVAFFAWIAAIGKILTMDNLRKAP